MLKLWKLPILDPNVLIYIPYPKVNCLKTIPFTAAHTHIAHIWQYPPPPARVSPPKVVAVIVESIAYQRWSFTRVPIIVIWAENLGGLDRLSLVGDGRFRKVVALRGLTIFNIYSRRASLWFCRLQRGGSRADRKRSAIFALFINLSFHRFDIRSCLATNHNKMVKNNSRHSLWLSMFLSMFMDGGAGRGEQGGLKSPHVLVLKSTKVNLTISVT